jgi:hypothetical protein
VFDGWKNEGAKNKKSISASALGSCIAGCKSDLVEEWSLNNSAVLDRLTLTQHAIVVHCQKPFSLGLGILVIDKLLFPSIPSLSLFDPIKIRPQLPAYVWMTEDKRQKLKARDAIGTCGYGVDSQRRERSC